MNFTEIEKRRSEVSTIISGISGMPKIIILKSFYLTLFSTEDTLLIEAFSSEFLADFLEELKSYSPFFTHPKNTTELLNILYLLKGEENLSNYSHLIEETIFSINKKLELFLSFLNGNFDYPANKGELLIPFVGKVCSSCETLSFSTIEKVRIKLAPSREKDSFLFVPSNQKKEQLEEQLRKSYKLAKHYIKEFDHKLCNYHEVLVYFDNIYAEYDGNSLGIALTVGLIEQFSLLYNLPFVTHIQDKVASTGGIDENGNVLPVGNKTIEQKVTTVFYSTCETFIIPKADETQAREKLNELKSVYPHRNLKIVSIESLEDLLNRRNLINIKKQSFLMRTARRIKRNWVAASLTLIIVLIIGFIQIRDYDDNPTTFELTNSGYSLFNKNGKALWTIDQHSAKRNLEISNNPFITECFIRILDINGDGKNEVLYSFQVNSIYSGRSTSDELGILNSEGILQGKLSFSKKLTSKREFLSPPYGIVIFDTLTYNGEKSILVAANNSNSYAAALFILGLNNNRIISDTLWNSGHYLDARVVDLNNDGNIEIAALAQNNGMKKGEFFIVDLHNLKGQIPTTKEYQFNDISTTKLIDCYLIPNTDFGKYLNVGSTSFRHRGINIETDLNLMRFVALDGGYVRGKHMIYNYDYLKKDFSIAIGNDFRYTRDSLVSIGKLKKPYSDTKEFRELLRKQIQAWDGKNFIPLEKYKQIKN